MGPDPTLVETGVTISAGSACLGDSSQPHHAAKSASQLSRGQHLHVGRQAASKNFSTVAALRVLSGALVPIADPAFLLITRMFYTRAEQPSRISCWYAFNGIGVAGGGLIGPCSVFDCPLRTDDKRRLRNRTHQWRHSILEIRV